ncbi:hypothetical protein M8C21_001761 [Ambrosia artemisiifolia]|uniref:Uncharacterized protein n=1 Tax=Ambrosia artemisiifolia TaxID=4212 RepID=A0AAD5GK54_AMBAR|nr:hypothetical protein M8C21_001761 [Ambrosia artemisiifolia]
MEGREYRPYISTKEVKGTVSNVASTGTTKYRHFSRLERPALRTHRRLVTGLPDCSGCEDIKSQQG